MGLRNKKQLDDMRDKKEYEEAYMVRLQMTKKQKQATRKSQVSAALNSLLDFGDYGALEGRKPGNSKDKTVMESITKLFLLRRPIA